MSHHHHNNHPQEGRIVVSSVLGGAVIALASMFFLMSFAAAIGVWSFRFDEAGVLTNSFWVFSSVAWTASTAIGAFICVTTMRTNQVGTSLLNAFIMWAVAYLVFGGMTLTVAQTMSQALFANPTRFMLGTGFIGDACGLVGALLFGRLALWVRSPEPLKRKSILASSTDRGIRIPVHSPS